MRRLLTAVAVVAVTCSGYASAETWTSLRGTHSVQARMIGLWDGNVILQLNDGRRVTIGLKQLRSDSRIQAQELAKKLAGSRSDRVKELQGQAVAAAAPAPSPLPQPPAAPPYVPPKPGGSPAEFIQQIDDAIAGGHIRAIYDALPPSYRNDVNDLVKLAAQNVRHETWMMLIGTTHQIGDLLVTRQNWFLSSPRIKALPPGQAEIVQRQVLGLASVLREGLNPDAMQLEKLQTMDFSQWLSERDQAIAPHLAQLFEYGASSPRQITFEPGRDGSAVVTFDQGGVSSKVTYVSIDGYWVPKSLADGWAASVEAWKADFSAGATSLDNYASIVTGASPLLQSLASANEAGQFHTAMESAFTDAEAAITTLATMFGARTTLAARGGGRNDYGDGDLYDDGDLYGDEMEEDYDMEMEMEMEEEYGDVDMDEMEMEEEMEFEMEEEMEE